MSTQHNLTQAKLKELLHYDPDTGIFTWKIKPRKNTAVGAVAGYAAPGRYVQIGIDGTQYYAHRLAWLYVHGHWPTEIDHENGNRHDNSISNIRDCVDGHNNQNRIKTSRNSSGFAGVWWDKSVKKWTSSVGTGRSRLRLGYYSDPEEARLVYVQAKLVNDALYAGRDS